MNGGAEEPAEILAGEIRREAQVRHAGSVEIDTHVLAAIEQRLDAECEAVAEFFAIRLRGREGAGLLRYGAGGFYRPHRDQGDLPAWPAAAERRITAVVFLNDDFAGGLLRLYGEGGPGGRPPRDSLDIVPRAGLLVAFPADMLHEVTPVTRGVRDVVVDWFT